MHARVTPLRDVDDQILGRWRELGARAVQPNPFAQPDFVLPAARALPGGAAAGLLHVDDGAEMVFALPVVRHRRYRRLPIGTIATWRHPYCFHGAPLAAPARARDAWDAVLDHLRRDDPARLLALELLPLEEPGLAALLPGLRERGLHAPSFDAHARPVIDRRPAFDYFDGQMSGKRRKNLKRQRRHLDAALEGTLRRVDWARHVEALPAAIELFLELERAGWKGTAGTALACHPADTAFFRTMIDEFSRTGRLQLWFFEAAGTPVAAQCNLIDGDTVFHFKIAYDEAFAGYSPGVLLELEMVEEFHLDRKLRRIDSCASPGSMYDSLYPDRRSITGALVPLHRGTRLVAETLAVALRGREQRALRHPQPTTS